MISEERPRSSNDFTEISQLARLTRTRTTCISGLVWQLCEETLQFVIEPRSAELVSVRYYVSIRSVTVSGDGDGALCPRPRRLVVSLFRALESQHFGKEGIGLLEDLAW